MNKAHRCYLHLACIVVKLPRGKNVRWHWQHLIREFGFGAYCEKQSLYQPELEKLHAISHP